MARAPRTPPRGAATQAAAAPHPFFVSDVWTEKLSRGTLRGGPAWLTGAPVEIEIRTPGECVGDDCALVFTRDAGPRSDRVSFSLAFAELEQVPAFLTALIERARADGVMPADAASSVTSST